MGAPWPCGVFMTRTKLLLMPPSDKAGADYIGTPDTTLAGSRNGITPLLLWNFISIRIRTIDSLTKLQQDIGLDLWVTRSPLSLAVLFKEPKYEIMRTFSLSGMTIYVNGVPRRYCHVMAALLFVKQLGIATIILILFAINAGVLCTLYNLVSDLSSLVQATGAMRVVVAAARVAAGEVVVGALVPIL
ncbi:hypothetical protein EMCRGX_G000521 [Ephydatia muelleri]